MKYFFLLLAITITIKTSAQVTVKDKVVLSPAAKIVFANVKTQLSNEEKNFFAKDVYIQKQDRSRLTVDPNGEDQGVLDVEIYPTDINKDGIEEIFTRTSGTFFSQWLQDLYVYIKNTSGKFILQQDVFSPRLYARASGFGGYPDLVGGAPEGPGFHKSPTKFDVFRWDGNKYKLYKKNQPIVKTDKSIDEVVSPEYVKTRTTNASQNNTTAGKPRKMAIPVTSTSDFKATEPTTLTPMAAMLFSNVKTKLTISEKNDLTQKTGVTGADTLAKTRKGKPKTVFTIYPTDLNKDGTEEIFLEVTTSPLGIPLRNYLFFAKGSSDMYQPLPGKIGQGVKIILNSKAGYPDLINGVPGLARQVWSWDGKAYRLQQTLSSSVNIQYKPKDIDEVSMEYTGR